MSDQPKITVIGSGFAGLAAATTLAAAGKEVQLFEKNEHTGGRARQFSAEGFVFDMGPSWYWMPDVIERFFNAHGKSATDYYDLVKLDPAFRIFFEEEQVVDVPNDVEALKELFESIEKGSARKLTVFLNEAREKYRVSMGNLIYRPSYSWMEFIRPEVLKNIFRFNLLQSYHNYVRKYFTDSRLIRIMEFPVLFLGALPKNTPALYSIMNYAGLELGTWYPKGGFYKIIAGMQQLAESHGVAIHTHTPIEKINVKNGQVTSVTHQQGTVPTAGIIAGSDYHHTEQHLLEAAYRNYDAAYWEKRTLAPSCLIWYLGLNKKIKHLQHHNLFFDRDFSGHAETIYTSKTWPKEPLFYVCCPSKTDDTVAPEGHENLFILIPVAPGIKETEDIQEHYLEQVLRRLEKNTGEQVTPHIVYKRSYGITDFTHDYNAYKGNAYGLANTLRQTAVWKPSLKNKKVSNLFYTGQLTVPGPGVPPSIISGQIAAKELLRFLKK